MSEDGSTPRRFQAEMLVAVSAVLIGVCALGVSLYEASLMREEQRAAVLPILELGRSIHVSPDDAGPDDWRLSIHAQNVGIGPARILDFLVTVDGVPQPTWGAAMRKLLGRDIDVQYGQSSINGRTIPPDRSVTMFDLVDTHLASEIVDGFERLDFSACYCSVFDECWTAGYAAFGAPATVDHCQRSEHSFRE